MNKTNQPITPLIDPHCDIYVETGTLAGESLDAALTLPQFKAFYSIELSDEWFNYCKNKYKANNRVKIVKGDSGVKLGDVLAEIDDKHPNSRICCFLDSHYSGDGTAKGPVSSPIKAELNALLWYRHLVHQIFIDDIACPNDIDTGLRTFETNEEYYSGWVGLQEIHRQLFNIAPHYQIKEDWQRRVWGLLYTTNGKI